VIADWHCRATHEARATSRCSGERLARQLHSRMSEATAAF
jgi:hypothetical protein